MAPQDEHYPKSGTLGKKERPILLNDEMVRAVLEGRKTQTRRLIKSQDVLDSVWEVGAWDGPGEVEDWEISRCPYGQVGDRLWVRECFGIIQPTHSTPGGKPYDGSVKYRADGDESPRWEEGPFEFSGWRPSIHMPRWASRITLEITGVRVECLQDISEDDADAEAFGGDFPHRVLPDLFSQEDGNLSIVQCFARLWDSIYSKPCKKCKGQGCITAWTGSENGSGVAIDSEDCPKCKGSQPNSWESNPWVWVIEFRRVES